MGNWTFVTFALSLVGFAACTPPSHSGADGGCPPCTAEQYCCLGACQPLGTTCGATDAGQDGSAGDAAPMGDASAGDAQNPCADNPCNPGYVCVQWTDASGAVQHGCADQHEQDVCVPGVDTNHCEGALARTCQPTGAEGPGRPPGYWLTVDCRMVAGADGVCVAGDAGTVRCASPGDVPCDPTTYHASCAGYCATQPGGGAVVRPVPCASASMCVSNAGTPDGYGCVPAGATMSTRPPTPNQVIIGCDGTLMRILQYGYEWLETCRDGEYCATPPGGGFGCIPVGATLCDPSTTPAVCASGTIRRYCSPPGYLDEETCTDHLASGWMATACDPNTHECVGGEACFSPFTETCVDASRKFVCSPAGLREVAPCSNCRPSASGSGVDCG